MSKFIKLRMLADDAMRNKDFKAADKQYYDAWCDYAQKRTAAAEIDKISEFGDTYSSEDGKAGKLGHPPNF